MINPHPSRFTSPDSLDPFPGTQSCIIETRAISSIHLFLAVHDTSSELWSSRSCQRVGSVIVQHHHLHVELHLHVLQRVTSKKQNVRRTASRRQRHRRVLPTRDRGEQTSVLSGCHTHLWNNWRHCSKDFRYGATLLWEPVQRQPKCHYTKWSRRLSHAGPSILHSRLITRSRETSDRFSELGNSKHCGNGESLDVWKYAETYDQSPIFQGSEKDSGSAAWVKP